MELAQIRKAESLKQLTPAIEYLCDSYIMHDITFGEFVAIKNTIESRAKELGHTWAEINEIASSYQEKVGA